MLHDATNITTTILRAKKHPIPSLRVSTPVLTRSTCFLQAHVRDHSPIIPTPRLDTGALKGVRLDSRSRPKNLPWFDRPWPISGLESSQRAIHCLNMTFFDGVDVAIHLCRLRSVIRPSIHACLLLDSLVLIDCTTAVERSLSSVETWS